MCLKTHLCGFQDESLSLILWRSLKNMITRSNTAQMLYVKRQKEKIYILSYGGIFPLENILSSAAYRSYRTENNWTKHLFQFSAASFQKN